MQIILPAAGNGKRFAEAGYDMPKPLVPVNDQFKIIDYVLDSLDLYSEPITFIVQREHCIKYKLDDYIYNIIPTCQIIEINYTTEGQLSTVLVAEPYIDPEQDILICNCDVAVNWNSEEFVAFADSVNADGIIVTTNSNNPGFSYSEINEYGFITRTAEKNVISSHGHVGVFYWKNAADFLKYAKIFIDKNIRINNEFYIAPMFNEAIEDGKTFRIFEIENSYSLGTPKELSESITNGLCL